MAELKPVYLLAGTDRPKIHTALERLRGHFPDEAVESVSALDASGDEAAGLCNAGSLFGDARLVLVSEVERWKAADVKALQAYLAAPAPATTLALVAGELRKDAPLAKACAKAGDVLVYDVPKRNLAQWVAERFRQLGARADAEACALLVQLVGREPSRLREQLLGVERVHLEATGRVAGPHAFRREPLAGTDARHV